MDEEKVINLAMAKSSSIIEHPADLGFRGWGDTLAELFEALAEAVADLICPLLQTRPTQRRQLTLQAEDLEALLVDFLWDVMTLVQSERFCISQIKVTSVEALGLVADIFGEPYDPQRHVLQTEVKAVTYHQLSIVQQDRRWVGQVILDL
jgi:SHS2 domain-containing protein